MTRRAADQMVDTVASPGIERIYGIVGDSLNSFHRRTAPPLRLRAERID